MHIEKCVWYLSKQVINFLYYNKPETKTCWKCNFLCISIVHYANQNPKLVETLWSYLMPFLKMVIEEEVIEEHQCKDVAIDSLYLLNILRSEHHATTLT